MARATDYRLLDRKVITQFNRLTEKNRITRGLIDWLGFNRDYVYFKVKPRKFGQAPYNFAKLSQLAMSSFANHSLFPLKFAGYLGIFITFFAGILGLFIFIERYVLKDPLNLDISGTAMLAVFTLFLVGVILVCLGLIALYIANIHQEVSGRPLYVVKERGNFNQTKKL